MALRWNFLQFAQAPRSRHPGTQESRPLRPHVHALRGPAVAICVPPTVLRGPVATLSGPIVAFCGPALSALRGPRLFALFVAPYAFPSCPRCRPSWPSSCPSWPCGRSLSLSLSLVVAVLAVAFEVGVVVVVVVVGVVVVGPLSVPLGVGSTVRGRPADQRCRWPGRRSAAAPPLAGARPSGKKGIPPKRGSIEDEEGGYRWFGKYALLDARADKGEQS